MARIWYLILALSVGIDLWLLGSAPEGGDQLSLALPGFMIAKTLLITLLVLVSYPGRQLRAGLLMLVVSLLADAALLWGFLSLTGLSLPI